MNQQIGGSEQQYADIESYRKLIKNLLDLRRYKSALYWAEKVAVLSQNNSKDIYQLAHCMFMLKEYNRASHVIKKNGLEKKNLLCLTLLVESLYASKEFQEALTLLNLLDVEDLNTSLNDEMEVDLSTNHSNDGLKNVT